MHNSSFFLFLSELRVYLDIGGDDEGDGAEEHDDEEEVAIAHPLLQGTGEESGDHHRQRHEGGAEGVMARLVVALAVVDEIEHVGCEAEAIAKLFEEDAEVDHHEALGQGVAHVDIDDVGQRDSAYHGPQPALQAILAGSHAAEDATEGQSDDAHRSLYQSVFLRRQTESASTVAVDEEECRHLGEQSLGHAIEEHEEQGDDRFAQGHLGEEGLHHADELMPDGAQCRPSCRFRRQGSLSVGERACLCLRLLRCTLRLHARQGIAMPEPERDEDARDTVEHEAPRIGDAIAEEHLQIASQGYQQPLAEDGGDAIERAAYAHEPCLVVLVEADHVEAVGGDVVGSAGEGHEPEEAERPLQPERRGYGEGHTAEGCSDEQLHGDDPPPLGLDDVDQGAPQGLDDPGEIEPRGVERDLCVAQPQLFVEHERNGHDGHVGQSFCEIQGGHPGPGRLFIVHNA